MIIENGFPMPKSEFGLGNRKYPFGKMEIGQSIFFEGERSGGRPHVAARIYGMRNGKKFSVRKCEGGLRIWRVE